MSTVINLYVYVKDDQIGLLLVLEQVEFIYALPLG